MDPKFRMHLFGNQAQPDTQNKQVSLTMQPIENSICDNK